MKVTIDAFVNVDPQQQPPRGFCPVCGMEIYGQSAKCEGCERSGHDVT